MEDSQQEEMDTHTPPRPGLLQQHQRQQESSRHSHLMSLTNSHTVRTCSVGEGAALTFRNKCRCANTCWDN